MRYKLMSIFDSENNIIIYDPNSIDWSSYPGVTGFYKHYVSDSDIIKFYNVAETYYGNVDYEDIILLINNIENVWDLYPGAMIQIPKKDELDSFILANIK